MLFNSIPFIIYQKDYVENIDEWKKDYLEVVVEAVSNLFSGSLGNVSRPYASSVELSWYYEEERVSVRRQIDYTSKKVWNPWKYIPGLEAICMGLSMGNEFGAKYKISSHILFLLDTFFLLYFNHFSYLVMMFIYSLIKVSYYLRS